MPHEYTDDEDRAPPYNDAVASEQGVSGAGGYTVPVPADYTLRGYKSTAVMLNGHGTAVTVEVGWRHSDDVAGSVMLETKAQDSALASTLLFVNQGDILDHVTLTGGGNIDYSVVESNQLPLPPSAAASGAIPFLILQGNRNAVANPPVGDSDHGKFYTPWKFTNAPSLFSYTLDTGGSIKEVLVNGPVLVDVTCQYKWAAAAAAYDRTTLINIVPSAGETYNGTTLFGVSPDDRVTTDKVYDGTLRAVFPTTHNNCVINVQPSNGGAVAVDFTPVYLTVLLLPLS